LARNDEERMKKVEEKDIFSDYDWEMDRIRGSMFDEMIYLLARTEQFIKCWNQRSGYRNVEMSDDGSRNGRTNKKQLNKARELNE
jgi:hypothetical protein